MFDKALFDAAASAGRAAGDALDCGWWPCGFAWVTIKPGTSKAAKAAKLHAGFKKAYGGGVQLWIHDHNQSMDKKAAHARAYAAVLKAAGIPATADSRMD